MREGELAALHVEDIKDNLIHVHRQQLRVRQDGHLAFCEAGYTNNEREHPQDGRLVPVSKKCEAILHLAALLPGASEYLFHDANGQYVTKDSYAQNLRRRCIRLGIKTTNNHAFRVAYNSRLIRWGISVADRAYILGHAVETNERNYSVSDNRRRYEMRDRILAGEKKTGGRE